MYSFLYASFPNICFPLSASFLSICIYVYVLHTLSQIHTCPYTHSHTAVKDMTLPNVRIRDFFLVFFLLWVYPRGIQQTSHISMASHEKYVSKPVPWSGNVNIRLTLTSHNMPPDSNAWKHWSSFRSWEGEWGMDSG